MNPPPPRSRIMVAHRSSPIRAYVRSLLEMQPAMQIVAEAGTGKEALSHFQRYAPAIVLIDLCLPDRNGFEVARCLRQSTPGCLLILLTQAFDPCVEEVARLIGIDGVCPADQLGQLRHLLHRLLGDVP